MPLGPFVEKLFGAELYPARLASFRRRTPAAAAAVLGYAALFTALATSAWAQNTINVPADQATIQAGIDAAANGDTVLVAPGTYYENVDFKGKAITVTSASGPGVTTIDGSNNPGLAVVAFQSGEQRTSLLSGFTIEHGGTQTATSQASGGIYIHAAAPTILNNHLGANHCSGIFANGGALIQSNSVTATVYQNPGVDVDCQQGGTGIVVEGTTTVGSYSYVQLIGNTVVANTQAVGVGGIEINSAEGTFLQNNIIAGNTGSYVGGIETDNVSSVIISNNLLYSNTAGQGNGPGRAGGLELTAPTSYVAENTFASDSLASGASGESAAEINIATQVAQVSLSNNIVVSYAAGFPALNCSVSSSGSSAGPILDHNDIYNPNGPAYGGACSAQTGTSGNISADPLFVTPGSNFELTLASPAVDSGDNNAYPMAAFDLLGDPRIEDATNKGVAIVDMGAYEYVGALDGPPYNTVLATSLNPAPLGQQVTFTASVTASSFSIGNPAGTITFSDGGTVLSTQTLQITAALNGTASFSTSTLTAGSHTITATFDLPSGSQAGSASLVETITGIASTTTLSSSVNPSLTGQSVTFTANVAGASANGGTPSGTVSFLDGAAVLATQPVSSAGNTTAAATYTTSALSVGAHTITANYSGNSSLASSSSTLTQTVLGNSTTTTTISGSPNPALQGKNVAFAVTVTGALAAAGAPTGSVTLTLAGTTVLATQTVTASGATTSQATFNISSLPLGAQVIQASYTPTGNFVASAASMTETIVLPPDFSLTPSQIAISLQTQHHTTTTLTLTSLYSFQDSVAISCGTLPAYVTCRLSPASSSLTAGATATVSLYIDTDSVIGYARLDRPSRPGTPGRIPPATGLAILAPAFLAASSRRFKGRRLAIRLLVLLASCGLIAGLAGCGSDIIPAEIPPSATPGTYSIPITATGATTGIVHTSTLSLTITP